MKWLLVSMVLILIQTSLFECELITEKAADTLEDGKIVSDLNEKVEKIFSELTPYSDNSTEKILVLSGKTDSTAYLESSLVDVWNGGSENSYKIAQAADISLKGYKKLLSTEKTVSLGFENLKLPGPFCPRISKTCNADYPYRLPDGSCNNLDNSWWGAAETPYQRFLPPDYNDDVTEPRILSVDGSYLPSARKVTIIVNQQHKTESDWPTMFLWFGQSVVHDISLISSTSYANGQPKSCTCQTVDPDCFNIPVPPGDYYNKDLTCIPFLRSSPSIKDFNCNLGPREQLNLVTHWLDLSHVYGTKPSVAAKIRLFKDGLLKYSRSSVSPLQQLPLMDSPCSPLKRTQKCFFTADPRGEDNAFLTSMHTIWLREHNRIAKQLSYLNPKWCDEKIFQETRRIVIAEMQHIVYNEYLPILIGDESMEKYKLSPLNSGYSNDYNKNLYPQLDNELVTAALRICHTMIPLDMKKADQKYNLFDNKPINYYIHNSKLAFSNPDAAIRGSIVELSYLMTPQINSDLNNRLFESLFSDSPRYSLGSLNMQRGRDHGIPGYNFYRKKCGLKLAKTFDDLTHIPASVISKLKQAYDDVDDIDLFIGLISETPEDTEIAVGPTAACIIGHNFRTLKNADRFWYENNGKDSTIKFTSSQLENIRKASLARLLCDTLDITFIQKFPLIKIFNNDTIFNQRMSCSSIPSVDLRAWKDSY